MFDQEQVDDRGKRARQHSKGRRGEQQAFALQKKEMQREAQAAAKQKAEAARQEEEAARKQEGAQFLKPRQRAKHLKDEA